MFTRSSSVDVARRARRQAAHDIRRERDAIASLRAEWARLGNPSRIQTLAQRHLPLKPIQTRQIDTFDSLPKRPPQIVPPGTEDPIAAILENISEDLTASTGSFGSLRGAGKGDRQQ